MEYHSITFQEFTAESFERIEHYRREEAQRLATLAARRQTLNELPLKELTNQQRMSKVELIDLKRAPDPQLAVGQTLPESLQKHFPHELIGKPIEEIDPYYSTEYVCQIQIPVLRCFLFPLIGFRGYQSKQNYLSIQCNTSSFFIFSFQLFSPLRHSNINTSTFQYIGYANYFDQLRFYDFKESTRSLGVNRLFFCLRNMLIFEFST